MVPLLVVAVRLDGAGEQAGVHDGCGRVEDDVEDLRADGDVGHGGARVPGCCSGVWVGT